jgi:hypothetical protein
MAVEGFVNWCGWHGMQGVRGSNPLSSTPGQRPSPPSTARRSPASGSKSAAICLCEANLAVRHAVDAGQHRPCRRPVDRAPTGPPQPARSCATKAGSTAHIFSITGSSGSGPGMKGRDCQVLLRSPTLPFGLPVFSRVRLVRFSSAWFAGAALALISRGPDGSAVQGDSESCGSGQISWAERWQKSRPRICCYCRRRPPAGPALSPKARAQFVVVARRRTPTAGGRVAPR